MSERSTAFSFEQQLRQRHARQFRLRMLSSCAAGFVVLAAAAPSLPPTSIGVIDRPLTALADLVHWVRAWISPTLTWLEAALSQAPALSLGLGALAVTAPLVIIGMLLRFALSSFHDGTVADVSAVAASLAASGVTDGSIDKTGHARPARAWLSRDDAAGKMQRHDLASDLTRIGRAADNEIRLKFPDVERYHAAISRSPEFDFYVVALAEGNARLEVNGHQVKRRRLRPGDVIAIGDVRFVFGREGR